MTEWKDTMRARLKANLATFGLSEKQRTAILEEELNKVVDTTESGKPFGFVEEVIEVDDIEY